MRLKESKTRRKEKFKDSESSKRKLLIDKLKSMLSEPRELSRREKDKPEKEKDSSTKRDRGLQPILRSPDKSNSKRSNHPSLSKPGSKEKTTCSKSKSKSKSRCKREGSRKRKRMPWSITL